jgi:hypothetical protein
MYDTIPYRVGRRGKQTESQEGQVTLSSFNDLPEPMDSVASDPEEAIIDLQNSDDANDDTKLDFDSRDMQDVPVGRSNSHSPDKNIVVVDNDTLDDNEPTWHHVAIPVHQNDVGASLPTAAEIRQSHQYKSDHSVLKGMSCMNRTRCKLVAIAVAIVIVLLALAAASSRRSIDNSSGPKPPASLDKVIAFLSEHNISSLQDLAVVADDTADTPSDTPLSPHQQAMSWLDYFFDIPTSMQGVEYESYVTRYVLALVYYALSGSNWWFALEFLSYDKDVCQWNSEVRSAQEQTASLQGVICDNDKHVVGLHLRTYMRAFTFIDCTAFVALCECHMPATCSRAPDFGWPFTTEIAHSCRVLLFYR